jgi:hypothetical protein
MQKRSIDDVGSEDERKKSKVNDGDEPQDYMTTHEWAAHRKQLLDQDAQRYFDLLWSFRAVPWVGRGAPREIIHMIAEKAAQLPPESDFFTLSYICQVHQSVNRAFTFVPNPAPDVVVKENVRLFDLEADPATEFLVDFLVWNSSR